MPLTIFKVTIKGYDEGKLHPSYTQISYHTSTIGFIEHICIEIENNIRHKYNFESFKKYYTEKYGKEAYDLYFQNEDTEWLTKFMSINEEQVLTLWGQIMDQDTCHIEPIKIRSTNDMFESKYDAKTFDEICKYYDSSPKTVYDYFQRMLDQKKWKIDG